MMAVARAKHLFIAYVEGTEISSSDMAIGCLKAARSKAFLACHIDGQVHVAKRAKKFAPLDTVDLIVPIG